MGCSRQRDLCRWLAQIIVQNYARRNVSSPLPMLRGHAPVNGMHRSTVHPPSSMAMAATSTVSAPTKPTLYNLSAPRSDTTATGTAATPSGGKSSANAAAAPTVKRSRSNKRSSAAAKGAGRASDNDRMRTSHAPSAFPGAGSSAVTGGTYRLPANTSTFTRSPQPSSGAPPTPDSTGSGSGLGYSPDPRVGAYPHAPPGAAADYMWMRGGGAPMPMHGGMHHMGYPPTMPYGAHPGMAYGGAVPPPAAAGGGGYSVPPTQYMHPSAPYDDPSTVYDIYGRPTVPHEGWPLHYAPSPYGAYYDTMGVARGGSPWAGAAGMPPHSGVGYGSGGASSKGALCHTLWCVSVGTVLLLHIGVCNVMCRTRRCDATVLPCDCVHSIDMSISLGTCECSVHYPVWDVSVLCAESVQ